MPDADWSIYLIRCKNGELYTGITTDIDRRLSEHQSNDSRSSKYLRGRGPLQLAFQSRVGTRSTASKLEYHVKQLSRASKEQLIAGDLILTDVYASSD